MASNRRKTQTFLPSPVRDVTPEDERALMEQLGYVPPNVCRVSARSGDHHTSVPVGSVDPATMMMDTSVGGMGRPIAIMSYPLLVQQLEDNVDANDGRTNIDGEGAIHRGGRSAEFRGGGGTSTNKTPFPTLYWLSCPHVSRAVSELERDGYVRIFQRRLEDDVELGARWYECHDAYACERWSVLSTHDREWLLGGGRTPPGGDEREDQKRNSMREMIQTSGVAGTDHHSGGGESGGGGETTSVPSVKCLHSHYAHYRSQLSRYNDAGDDDDDRKVVLNMVGKWTHELLMECFPDILL
jgi:hypothetical protein